MEERRMKKNVAVPSVELQVPPSWKSSLTVGICLSMALGLISLLSCNKYSMQPDRVVETELDKQTKKFPVVQPPKDEVLLMNYNEFVDTFAFAEAISELEFLADMMNIAQHNLATLSGLETYYKRQSPSGSKLSDKFKDHNRTDIALDLLGADSPEHRIEGAVGHSEVSLKKVSAVGKLLRRFSNRAQFEIPNFPLDQQPDPEHITHIDADLRDCLGGIRDQGKCGACYAFSWISLVEWHYCKQNNGKEVDFSEQHILDCIWQVKREYGCDFGQMSAAMTVTMAHGIHWEHEYPYKAVQSRRKCGKLPGAFKAKVNYQEIKIDRENFEQILSEQPILVEVQMPDDIDAYSSGIHPGHNCDPDRGHGMLLVGHGRQEGKPYWLLRNSQGKHWGENGYLRISRDMPEMKKCFVTAFVVKFKFENLPEENYVDFYHALKIKPRKVKRLERMARDEVL